MSFTNSSFPKCGGILRGFPTESKKNCTALHTTVFYVSNMAGVYVVSANGAPWIHAEMTLVTLHIKGGHLLSGGTAGAHKAMHV